MIRFNFTLTEDKAEGLLEAILARKIDMRFGAMENPCQEPWFDEQQVVMFEHIRETVKNGMSKDE